jgi:hypothetical protein
MAEIGVIANRARPLIAVRKLVASFIVVSSSKVGWLSGVRRAYRAALIFGFFQDLLL